MFGRVSSTEYVPNFEYLVQDLTRYSDEEITGTAVSRVVMLLFKHIHDPDIFRKLPAIFTLMQELLTQERGLHTIEMLLRDVFNALEDMTVTQLVTIAEKSLQGEIVMTLAEQLRQEGLRNGVNLKFGEEHAQKVMPVIREIHDVNRLQALKDALKQIRQLKELNALIEAS